MFRKMLGVVADVAAFLVVDRRDEETKARHAAQEAETDARIAREREGYPFVELEKQAASKRMQLETEKRRRRRDDPFFV